MDMLTCTIPTVTRTTPPGIAQPEGTHRRCVQWRFGSDGHRLLRHRGYWRHTVGILQPKCKVVHNATTVRPHQLHVHTYRTSTTTAHPHLLHVHTYRTSTPTARACTVCGWVGWGVGVRYDTDVVRSAGCSECTTTSYLLSLYSMYV